MLGAGNEEEIAALDILDAMNQIEVIRHKLGIKKYEANDG